MKILMVGYSTDATLRHSLERAKQLNIDFEALDLLALRDAKRLRITQTPEDLVIEMEAQTIQFSHFQSFYNRGDYADFGQPLRNQAISRISATVSAWLEFSRALVVNRTSAGAPNANKFLHAVELRRFGFRTPEQMIVGTKSSAESVLDTSGTWISKSCSGSRSISTALDQELWERFHLLKNSPSLFQRRIVGPDVRVHVVGDQIFPEMIVSQTIDYRFPRTDVPNVYSDCGVPDDIGRLCIAYCKFRGLLIAGFDFKINHRDGYWYAFEANPRPGYESFDRRQGFRISNALLSLLNDGPSRTEVHNKSTASICDDPFISQSRRPPFRPYI